MKPAFANIETWIFDLDNTLYASDGPIYSAIGERMTAYVARVVGVDADTALGLRERYLHEHGATMAGLVANHAIDPHDFLNDVHGVDLSVIDADPDLAALIAALPGRRLIYTNGPTIYAREMVERLGLMPLMEDVFSIETAELFPKPTRESFERFLARYRFDPKRALMIEDTARNLETAHAFGVRTALLHPEPDRDWPEHVHHTADSIKSLLRHMLDLA